MCGSDLTGTTTGGALAATGSLMWGWQFLAAMLLVLVGFVCLRIAYQRRQSRTRH